VSPSSARPPFDIVDVREPCFPVSALWQTHHHAAVVPSVSDRLHFLPDLARLHADEWLYNGGPYQLIIFHFLIGIFCWMDEMGAQYAGNASLDALCLRSAQVGLLLTAVLLSTSVGQGPSPMACLGISGTFNFMLVLKAEHNRA